MKCLFSPGYVPFSKSLFFVIFFFCIRSMVFAQVDARFAVDTLQNCIPFTVHCTPAANDNVTKWEWTTSDGQTSTEQNPAFTFTKPGKFRIKLKTSNYSLSDSALLEVKALGVSAKFTYQYNSICSSPVPVQFNPAYSELPGNYHWDFGDSTVSIEASPNHVYQTAGAYRIQLITYSREGCIDSSVNMLQTGQVTVDFDLPNLICTNTAIAFTSLSSAVPKSATWQIDSKVVSTSISSFIYRFTEPGTHTVQLTQNFGGCSFSKTKQVTVLRRPAAAFSESGTLESCIYPVPVQFSNTSQNADSYHWDFGDGGIATDGNPLYSYNSEGRFTPVLIATDANGCADTLSKPNLVFIGPPIISSLRNLPQSRCLPDTLKTAVNMLTPEGVVSYDWNFGNGDHSSESMPVYMYTRQGYYDVSLIVKTVSGCTDTFFVKKAVSAGDSVVPDFTIDKTIACASDSFHFTALIPGKFNNGMQWSFGENYQYSSNLNPIYRYHSSGTKTVSLAVNNNGCLIRTTKKDFISIKPPVANIGVIYDCTNQLNVVFKDSSDGAQSWQWNFGDGTPEVMSANPMLHSYAASGIYTVTLHTTNAECKSTDTLIVPVLNTKPIFTFAPADGYVCRKAGVTMSATNPEYIADYYWDFDNGKSAFSSTSISTYYDKTGTYHPSLVTRYRNGCRDTLYSPQPVRVTGPTAAFNTGAGASCVNGAVTFADKSTTDGAHDIVNWQWSCGDAYTETRTVSTFSHNYAGYGSYKASLLIRDNNNCTDTAYYTVKVSKLPSISAGRDTFVCDGNNKVLLTANGGVSYIWHEDASLSCTDCAATTASPFAATTYMVTGTDANGCANTDTVQVAVVRPFNLSVVPSVEICESEKMLLIASGADLYSWQPPDGLINPSSSRPYASPGKTTKYTVTGSDKYHCFSQTGDVWVTVHPKPAFTIDSSLFVAQKGDINLLQTTGSDNIISWQWSPSAGLSCTNCAQPYATAVKSVTYTAIAITEYGCTDTDKVSIHVLCNQSKIYLPTAFTPNNDGRNDWFYVMSSVDNPVVSFVVYNRSGERLFAKTNILSNAPEQGWNGMYKGQAVSQDTYIYRIEIKCNEEVVPFTGTITVVR